MIRLPAFSKLPLLRMRVVAPASAAISRTAPGALRKTAPLPRMKSAPLVMTLAPVPLVWVRVRPLRKGLPLMVRGPSTVRAAGAGDGAAAPVEGSRDGEVGAAGEGAGGEVQAGGGEGCREAEIEGAAGDGGKIGKAVGGGAEEVEAGVGERLQRSRAGEDGVLEGACAEGEGEGGAGIHLIGAGVGAGAADPDACPG